MAHDFIVFQVKGHCKIVDDLGNVLLDKDNAVHPQNMARVISRALGNEFNYYINSMAFGNGGTSINAAYQIQYNPVNDGQPPDQEGWQSRLYHETYREIVNATGWPPVPGSAAISPLLGTDPGSADPNTGVRAGGGAVSADDPPSIPFVSGPGVYSTENTTPLYTSNTQVVCVLNAAEPTGQYLSDLLGPDQATNTSNPNAASFTFDEMGLYTSGAPAIASSGYDEVDVGNQTALNDSGLVGGNTYNFHISVDGGPTQPVVFTVPAAGGTGPSKGSYNTVYYGDIIVALTTCPSTWAVTVSGNPVINANFLGSAATVNITNDGTFSQYVQPAQTYGYLTFTSSTTGPTSTVLITAGTNNPTSLYDLIRSMTSGGQFPGGATIQAQVYGQSAGVQNDPLAPATERERLLTHLIFSPITKAANRTLTITYTLTISVARTPTS